MRFIKEVKKHPLFWLIISGLLLRLTLLFIDYSWDVNNHIAWAKDLHNRGFQGFYETQSSEVYATLYPNYPPLSLFIFYLVYPLQSFIYSIAWWLNLAIPLFPSKLIFFIKDRAFLAGLMKLPAIFTDLAIAWLSYLIAKKILLKNKRVQMLIPSLILFNPAFFFNSGLWGQIDSIPIFFALGSFYLLLFTRRFIASGIFMTFALLVKPTALIYLPIYIALLFMKFGLKNFLKTFIAVNLIFWFAFLPFYKSGNNLLSFPYNIYLEKILSTQSLPYVTNGAFNFWVLVTWFNGIKDTSTFILGLSYRVWGYLIVGIFTLFILICSKQRSRLSRDDVFYSIFLLAFAAFLFLTKMHERYSLLPLAFLLIAAIKKQKLLKWFSILSLVSFLNHYHSWPVPKIEILVKVIFNPLVVVILSLLNVILFLYLLSKHMSFRT